MIDDGSRPVRAAATGRVARARQGVSWIAYGIVRVVMGLLGYGGDEWWRARLARRR